MEKRILVGLEEAAEVNGLTTQQLWRWVKADLHGIPAYGSGRSLRFDLEELRIWLRVLRHFDKKQLADHVAHGEGEAA